MKSDITRHRIEKYLHAHGVKCTEPALMRLTRFLIDKTPEEAKEDLKVVILSYKRFGYPINDEDIAELFSENVADVKREIIQENEEPKSRKVYLVPRVGAGGGTVTRRVTKKEYIIDNIIGFSVSGFIVVCIVVGIFKAIFY